MRRRAATLEVTEDSRMRGTKISIGIHFRSTEKAGSCFPHISSSVLWILVKLGTYGKIFSRRTQRRWNREKRFRIDGDIPEISFTNLSFRGGMKFGPLTKPPRNVCGDEQLLWRS